MAGDGFNNIGIHRGKEIDLRMLAQWDFRMDWAVIAILVFVPSWIPLYLIKLQSSLMFFILVTAAIASWGWACWCTHRLLEELKDRWELKLAFWLMSPAVPLAMIFMGVTTARAGSVLARHGIKVGFFGITRRKLKELSPGMCPKCGYDVRAIRSGVCPECGTKIGLCRGCGYDMNSVESGICPECGVQSR